MNAFEARALLFQRKLQELPVDISIPGCEALDGLLSVLEIRGTDTTKATKLAETPQGIDGMLVTAATICQSLVLRETKERILTDTDVEAVAQWGMTVLQPLGQLVTQASGMSPNAVADAKKNSLTSHENALSSSSPEN